MPFPTDHLNNRIQLPHAEKVLWYTVQKVAVHMEKSRFVGIDNQWERSIVCRSTKEFLMTSTIGNFTKCPITASTDYGFRDSMDPSEMTFCSESSGNKLIAEKTFQWVIRMIVTMRVERILRPEPFSTNLAMNWIITDWEEILIYGRNAYKVQFPWLER